MRQSLKIERNEPEQVECGAGDDEHNTLLRCHFVAPQRVEKSQPRTQGNDGQEETGKGPIFEALLEPVCVCVWVGGWVVECVGVCECVGVGVTDLSLPSQPCSILTKRRL